MRAKPYILTALFLISCGIFCISCFKIAGTAYLETWEAIGMISGVVAGFSARAVYDYIRRN